MIPSRKVGCFQRWFARDAEKRIHGAMHEVRVRGLDHVRHALARGPVLVVTNHTAWWDALVALVVSTRILKADAFAMMDAKNLVRLPFFGLVGAFGVDLEDPRDGARAVRYARTLLAGTNRLVWIFAQGREVPITVRPLGFRRGSAEIARIARARVVPGAIRYEMGSAAEPTLWLSFGDPVEPLHDLGVAHARHEEAVVNELDAIERAVVSEDDRRGFVTLHQKRPSLAFSVAERLLAWMTKRHVLGGGHRSTSKMRP
jgi:1-acyl-sn-glycerol-3-phosphate acyltransferase